MRFRIVRDVPYREIVRHTRQEFRPVLPPEPAGGGVCTLVVFEFQRDEKGSGVIMSNAVEKAMERAAPRPGERVIAFAGEFTLEASAYLREHGAEPVALSDWGWTDERYRLIKGPRPRR